MLILEVNQMGYEIQVSQGFAQGFSSESPSLIQVFTSLQIRDEQPFLFGFSTQAERDLFIQLISVSGIGAQLAIALIDTLGLEGLVQAVVTGNINQLSKTPGVGKKTAERLALELKEKLSQWRNALGLQTLSAEMSLDASRLEDLELTLLALGYSETEINQAIAALSQDKGFLEAPSVEEWIRLAITWLSQV